MSISNEQIKQLLEMITSVQPDKLDCDGCSHELAEFAEQHLLGKSLTESQQSVQTHLQNCHCCETEFKSLLAALENIEDA